MIVATLLLAGTPAFAADRMASFGIALISTSLEPVQPAETARIAALDRQLAAALADRHYTLVDMTPVQARIAAATNLQDCPACELELARQVGADYAVLGWVQKVSNLILNVNLTLHEVATGRLLRAGSADIRGNTDESWSRGLRYVLAHRIFPADKPRPGA
jgi:hypothetical protein